MVSAGVCSKESGIERRSTFIGFRLQASGFRLQASGRRRNAIVLSLALRVKVVVTSQVTTAGVSST
jgi:hypothetical protein